MDPEVVRWPMQVPSLPLRPEHLQDLLTVEAITMAVAILVDAVEVAVVVLVEITELVMTSELGMLWRVRLPRVSLEQSAAQALVHMAAREALQAAPLVHMPHQDFRLKEVSATITDTI